MLPTRRRLAPPAGHCPLTLHPVGRLAVRADVEALALLFLGDAQPHNHVDDLVGDVGDHRRPDERIIGRKARGTGPRRTIQENPTCRNDSRSLPIRHKIRSGTCGFSIRCPIVASSRHLVRSTFRSPGQPAMLHRNNKRLP